MKLEPLEPWENRLLAKHFWHKDTLSADESVQVARIAPISERNLNTVLAQGEIDVYLGTSMRDDEQYKTAIAVYDHLVGKGFNVFPPFFITSKSRLMQSELEAVVLDRCRMMVGVYGAVDTFGLDSEVVNNLLNEKPTFIYLAPQPDAAATQEQRYKIFHDVHPRTLIGIPGLLHGPHVTRDYETLDECMRRDDGEGAFRSSGGYDPLNCQSCSSTILALRTIR